MKGPEFGENLVALANWAVENEDAELRENIRSTIHDYVDMAVGREREAFCYLKSQCQEGYNGRGASTGDAPYSVRNKFRRSALNLNKEAFEKTGNYLFPGLGADPDIPTEDKITLLFKGAEIMGCISRTNEIISG